MNGEEMVAMIVFLGTFLAFTGMVLGFFRQKYQMKLKANEGDGSLRTSELKAIIREAVEEANAPLLDRIEALEGHLEEANARHLLNPPHESDYLSAASQEEKSVTIGRQSQKGV